MSVGIEAVPKNQHRHSAAGEEFPCFQKNIKNEILHYVQDDNKEVARQDKKRMLGRTSRTLGKTQEGLFGRTGGGKRDCDSKGCFSSTAEKVFQQHRKEDERANQNAFQTLSLRSVIKYTKSLLLSGFSEK